MKLNVKKENIMAKPQIRIGTIFKNKKTKGFYRVYRVDEGVKSPGSEAKVAPLIYMELWAKPFLSFTNQEYVTIPHDKLVADFEFARYEYEDPQNPNT